MKIRLSVARNGLRFEVYNTANCRKCGRLITNTGQQTTYNSPAQPTAQGQCAARGKRYEACQESKDTTCRPIWKFFNAYCGNTAVDLDPLLVSRARLTVVELALFE